MLWSWACAPEMPPEAPEAHAAAEHAAAGMPVLVSRRVALDPGRFSDGTWVSTEEAALRVSGPGGADMEGEHLVLAIGWNQVVVTRACGPVTVPVRADPGDGLVSVPFPACGAPLDAPAIPGDDTSLDRRERTAADLRGLQSLGFFPSLPATEDLDDAPARWLTRDEAEAACAFLGGRLPSLAEFRLARSGAVASPTGRVATLGDLDRRPTVGTAGHEDLGGNVAEWLLADPAGGPGAAGLVGGGSFLRPDESWVLPATARSDEIGFRCAFETTGD